MADLDLLIQSFNQTAGKIAHDPGWIKSLVPHLQEIASQAKDPVFKAVLQGAIQTVQTNQDRIWRLGIDGFSLFLHNVAAGKKDSAIEIYIRSQNPRELIDGMLQGSRDLIHAKQLIDAWTAEAKALAQDFAITAAKALLPLLLGLL